MEVKNLKRVFIYDNARLPDPDTVMSPDEVRLFYSNTYVELTQAVTEGPIYKESGTVAEYTFSRVTGTKG